MKSAKTNSPFLLVAVVFVAVVFALALSLSRQPLGEAVSDFATAQVADQTTQPQSKTPVDAKVQSDTTRRIINHAISATMFEGAPVLQ